MRNLKAAMIVGALAACVAGAGAVTTAGAQTDNARPIDPAQAKSIAIKVCDGGTVKSETTAMSHGVAAYVVDVNVANKESVEKVTVNKQTGAILGVTYDGQQA